MSLTTPDDVNNGNLSLDANGMVLITKENSTKVENMIKGNPKYSTPKAKTYFNSNPNPKSYTLNQWIDFINQIARDNSTRTSAKDITVLAQYIHDNSSYVLDKIETSDYSIVDELSNLKKRGATRLEPSLASKICRYLDEWHFNHDFFTINDSVVRFMLPYYYLYNVIDSKITVNVEKCDFKTFMSIYNQLFDKIKESEPQLTRHEMDHIIWYVYRNDSVRKAIAAALIKLTKQNNKRVFINCSCLAGGKTVFPESVDGNVLY